MSRQIPTLITDAVSHFADRLQLNQVQRDALDVIVRCAFENGFDRGRVDGAEGAAALMTPRAVTGGAA